MAQEEWCKPTKTVHKKTGTYQNAPKQSMPPTPEKQVQAKEGANTTNGFNLFAGSINSRMQKKYKNNQNLIRKACAREWKQLSLEDREVWREKAKALNSSRSCDEQPRSTEKHEKRKQVKRKWKYKENKKAEREKMPMECKTECGRNSQFANSSSISSASITCPRSNYGYEGLQNFGNSCWLNSLLQCICELNLSQNIEDDTYNFNSSNVGREAATTLRKMKVRSRPLDVHKGLYNQFLRRHKWGTGQQDAEEGLVLLMNDLKESCTGRGSLACQRASSVLSTFKKCLDCDSECHIQDEAMHSFSLTIPDAKETVHKELRLQNIYDQFFEAEILGKQECQVRCDTCKRETDHLKYSNIALAPEVLTLTLKRYTGGQTKKSERVRIDRTIQLRSRYITTSVEESKTERYHLKAVVLHVGEHLQTGHYKALLGLDADDKLVEVDDDQVRELKPGYLSSKLVETSCYILFYERDAQVEECSSLSGVDANLSGQNTHHDFQEETLNGCEKALTCEAKLKRCMNIDGRDEMFAEIAGIKIFGKDLKTLEYPQTDHSYSLVSPTGYVNDNILSASLSLIAKEAKEVGLTVKMFDTNLNAQLHGIQSSRDMTPEEKGIALIKLTTRMKSCKEGLVNYFVLPQLVDGCHWTLTIVKDKTQLLREIVFYDPLGQRTVDANFCKLLSLYIDYGQVFYSKPVISDTYREISITTEKDFPTQVDRCSCAVYCMVYARVVTSLLTFGAREVDTTRARTEIAKGLLNGEIDWSFLKLEPREDLGIVVHPPKRLFLLPKEQLNLKCVATGKGKLEYKWYDLSSGFQLSGSRSDEQSYSEIVNGPGGNMQLYCQVTDSSGNISFTDIVETTVLADFVTLNNVHSGCKASLMARAKKYWMMKRNLSSKEEMQEEDVNKNEVWEKVSSIKDYLLDIVCTKETSRNNHNQYRRHQYFISKGKKKAFLKECTDNIGQTYFGEETVEAIRNAVGEIFGQNLYEEGTSDFERPEFPKILGFQYLYLVLGTEAIIKLIMEKEKCSYQIANKLACQ